MLSSLILVLACFLVVVSALPQSSRGGLGHFHDVRQFSSDRRQLGQRRRQVMEGGSTTKYSRDRHYKDSLHSYFSSKVYGSSACKLCRDGAIANYTTKACAKIHLTLSHAKDNDDGSCASEYKNYAEICCDVVEGDMEAEPKGGLGVAPVVLSGVSAFLFCMMCRRRRLSAEHYEGDESIRGKRSGDSLSDNYGRTRDPIPPTIKRSSSSKRSNTSRRSASSERRRKKAIRRHVEDESVTDSNCSIGDYSRMEEAIPVSLSKGRSGRREKVEDYPNMEKSTPASLSRGRSASARRNRMEDSRSLSRGRSASARRKRSKTPTRPKKKYEYEGSVMSDSVEPEVLV